MSISISYFFNSDKTLPDLAAETNEVVGCSLRPSIGNPDAAFTAFPFFGMELSLSIHDTQNGYSDEDELKFSLYNYELDTTTYWGQADARPVQLPMLLSLIYVLHSRLGITGMLVYDDQLLLALYEERQIEENGNELYDTVSNSTFCRFGDHLRIIQERLPDDWRQAYVAE